MFIWDMESHRYGIIFKRHECSWVIPFELQKHMKYNPRHLPVVIPQQTCEGHWLFLSIKRILHGWRAFVPHESSKLLPPVTLLICLMILPHTSEARHVRHHDRSSITIFDPDRSRAVNDSNASVGFEAVHASLPYPFASGSAILDALTGRFPVTIGARWCTDPITDWQQITLTLAGARLRSR